MVVASASSRAMGGVKVEGGAGCVKATAEASCSDVSSGSNVGASAIVVAGSGGLVVSLADRTVVRLTEGSELKMLPRTKLQLGHGDTPAEAVQLVRGKLVAELGAGPGALLVKTSQPVAAVIKRGSAAVKVGDDVVLANLRGASVIGSGSEFLDVPEGKMRVLPKGDTFLILLLDGSFRITRRTTSEMTLRAMTTAQGGEVVTLD